MMNRSDISTRPLDLDAGETSHLEMAGRWFYIVESSAPLQVYFPEHGGRLDLEAGMGVKLPAVFSRFQLKSDSAQSVTVAAGFGEVIDNRAAGTISAKAAGAASIYHGSATVGIAAAVAVASRVGRSKVTIQNHGAASIWLGGSGVAVGEGAEIKPGGSGSAAVAGDIYAISTAAAVDISYTEEGD